MSAQPDDDFAWNGVNSGALLDWLGPMKLDVLNGYLRLAQMHTPCYFHRAPDGTITIEEPF